MGNTEEEGNFYHLEIKKEIQNYIDGSILTISDAPWPGFTPDLLSIILVVATQARGSVEARLANGTRPGAVVSADKTITAAAELQAHHRSPIFRWARCLALSE